MCTSSTSHSKMAISLNPTDSFNFPYHSKSLPPGDIDAAVSMEHNIITKMDNRKHLDVSDVKVELNIGSASVNLDNLFNGDAELGSMMNRFLNDNWREITAEIRPALAESTQHILRGMANRLTEMYSIDQFLPE